MKKILFISFNLNIGGGSLLLRSIVQGLDRNIYSPSVWGPCEGELRQQYEKINVPVFIDDYEVDRVNRIKTIEFNKNLKNKINKILKKAKLNKEKLAIRCSGTITNKLLKEFDFKDINLIGIFDNNPALIGQEIEDVKIYPANEIEKFNIDSAIIAHLQPSFIKQELQRKNIRKIYDIYNHSLLTKASKFLNYLIDLRKPLKLFIKINPDIVFVNNASNFWAVILGKLLGKKVIWSIHESFYPKTFRAFPQSLYFLSFKIADKFVFPSKAASEFYKEFVDQNKMEVIYGGVDHLKINEFKTNNEPQNLRKELNIPGNHKIISIIGTVEEIKGQIFFAQTALSLLNSSVNKNLTFLIVGSKNDEYSDKIEKLIEGSRYRDHFRVISVTKEVYKYFHLTDIYVCSSIKDSFPLAMLEAMGFEKPIVSSNVCGIPEAITHNQTGLLVSPEGMNLKLKEQIEYLIDNPEKAQELSKNAYEKFLNNFTYEIMLSKYIKLLNSL